MRLVVIVMLFFFFQAEDGIRDLTVTGVQTCALPICEVRKARSLLCCSASTAVRNVKIAWGPSSARSRARVARSRRTGSILDGRLLAGVAGRGRHAGAGRPQPHECEAFMVGGR